MEVLEEDSPMGMEEEHRGESHQTVSERDQRDRQEEEWSIPASVAGRNGSLVE